MIEVPVKLLLIVALNLMVTLLPAGSVLIPVTLTVSPDIAAFALLDARAFSVPPFGGAFVGKLFRLTSVPEILAPESSAAITVGVIQLVRLLILKTLVGAAKAAKMGRVTCLIVPANAPPPSTNGAVGECDSFTAVAETGLSEKLK